MPATKTVKKAVKKAVRKLASAGFQRSSKPGKAQRFRRSAVAVAGSGASKRKTLDKRASKAKKKG